MVPGLIEVVYGHGLGEFFTEKAKPLILGAIAAVVMIVMARGRGELEFGEKNAIDIETIGLFWHFVDIVWIIIFTAVYLLEYL